ncbi:antibiotic biosynthesis monooxygenase [Azonexus sp.]|jgi:quinol monooxygenase YgiN|uniref:putative quinol monooxygenase n=1 Tax=Azonexus sp. TaxID=1872668 RepID=UPI00283AA0E2|nr:antibiotic biosynthesis monooxygenase [Azonexus sp.]
MFVLMVELEAVPELAGELEQLLHELVEIAAHEPGVHFYAVQRDREHAARFMLCEFYADQLAWQAHLVNAPVHARLKHFERLLAVPPRVVQCDALAATPWRV